MSVKREYNMGNATNWLGWSCSASSCLIAALPDRSSASFVFQYPTLKLFHSNNYIYLWLPLKFLTISLLTDKCLKTLNTMVDRMIW